LTEPPFSAPRPPFLSLPPPGTGDVAGTPFFISGPQFEYWQHTHLTLDVVPGRGSGFSLESPEGVRFLIRSRLFTDEEVDLLARQGPPPRGEAAFAHYPN